MSFPTTYYNNFLIIAGQNTHHTVILYTYVVKTGKLLKYYTKIIQFNVFLNILIINSYILNINLCYIITPINN